MYKTTYIINKILFIIIWIYIIIWIDIII